MPNNRYRDMQAAGELTRKKRAALDRHPMGAREAIRIICELHSHVDDRGVVRVNFGMTPDFVKIDGGLARCPRVRRRQRYQSFAAS